MISQKDKKRHPLGLKESTYYVSGMHCPSCELLIEKGLLKYKGVESVEASAAGGEVVIFYQGRRPSVAELSREFQKNGYVFSEKPATRSKKPLFSFDQSGQLAISKGKLTQYVQIIGVVLLVIFAFFFLTQTSIASRAAVNSLSPLPAFFLFGLVAGISSCAALVGGIILSMSKQWSEIYQDEDSFWQKLKPHLLFNTGRVFSFALLGGLLGSLGSFLQISLTASSLLAIGVSIVMVLLAFQMLGVSYFRKAKISVPKFITRFVADESNFKGRYMPFALGALTFFLPCGFTLTAQGLALASGNSLRGLLIMLAFALGTLPMLSIIGVSTLKLTAKPHLSEKFLKIAGVLVLFLGIYNFNAQLNVLGFPSLSDLLLKNQISQSSKDGLAPIINGKQVLKMDALAYGYEPNSFRVRVGTPVRWEITNKGVSGCTNAIVSKGLFEGEIDLNQPLAIKEFTPQRSGRYKFSCWMGMISGVIEVVDQSGSPGEPSTPSRNEIPSGARGCSCTGGCGGGCGNPGCPYAK